MMKKLSYLVFSLMIFTAYGFTLPAYSQGVPTPAGNTDRPQLWMSHQMNQPGPEPAQKYKISQKLVDEIRQLYLQAKKEYDSKVEKKKTR
jgi:hypothetical protein